MQDLICVGQLFNHIQHVFQTVSKMDAGFLVTGRQKWRKKDCEMCKHHQDKYTGNGHKGPSTQNRKKCTTRYSHTADVASLLFLIKGYLLNHPFSPKQKRSVFSTLLQFNFITSCVSIQHQNRATNQIWTKKMQLVLFLAVLKCHRVYFFKKQRQATSLMPLRAALLPSESLPLTGSFGSGRRVLSLPVFVLLLPFTRVFQRGVDT